MRYVGPAFLHSTLSRGKSLEQFLGGRTLGSERCIRWIEIRPSEGRLELWEFVAPDFGDESHVDLYEFIGDDDGELLATIDSAVESLGLAEKVGALPNRWVNQFVVQDEYRDFIRAGRPDVWPGVVV
jgi:hypothetical protein